VDVRRLFEETLPEVLSGDGVTVDGAPLFSPDVAVAFDITDAGMWEVRGCADLSGVCVQAWDGSPRDCVVRCDARVLELLLRGGIRAARAYATGRALVEGDVGLLLRLRDALDGKVAL